MVLTSLSQEARCPFHSAPPETPSKTKQMVNAYAGKRQCAKQIAITMACTRKGGGGYDVACESVLSRRLKVHEGLFVESTSYLVLCAKIAGAASPAMMLAPPLLLPPCTPPQQPWVIQPGSLCNDATLLDASSDESALNMQRAMQQEVQADHTEQHAKALVPRAAAQQRQRILIFSIAATVGSYLQNDGFAALSVPVRLGPGHVACSVSASGYLRGSRRLRSGGAASANPRKVMPRRGSLVQHCCICRGYSLPVRWLLHQAAFRTSTCDLPLRGTINACILAM
eukprot:TRINITY_DN4765_c0_g1_i1.p1 TRINITY_DN4765_c0_g1~~TRINITY_DN4765_c0_g1_i1.p1  ORF type:complete len:283 (-),score=1.90 TRINITY_DN4765_c0_g1_i1:381-1229(-)